ncbi:MAG: DapH/DapD/GlmU-related protein [Bacteroidota bacterium]
MWIRITRFRTLGASIGPGVTLGKVFMLLPEKVKIGSHCFIEHNVRLRVGGPWGEGAISIGARTFIGHGTQINIGSHFTVGQDCLIAAGCLFSDAHHSFDNLNLPIREQVCNYRPIIIEDNVWLGTGVTVIQGVTIHKGAVIAAGAIVTKDVPANEIWGGIPARKLKNRVPATQAV